MGSKRPVVKDETTMPRIRVPGEKRIKTVGSPKSKGGVNLHQRQSRTSKYFTAQDRRDYSNAVERRTGARAWCDWQVVMHVLRKASDAAIVESGQKSREHPDYRDHFHRILLELPPICLNEHTNKRYRATLLDISYAGEKFVEWYKQAQPSADNPVSLLAAYKEETEPHDGKKDTKQPNQHAIELARVQEEGAAKIAELTKELNFIKGDNVESAGRRLASWPRDRVVAHILNLVDGWSYHEIDELYTAMKQLTAGRRQQVN
jgi:hypothetical protein